MNLNALRRRRADQARIEAAAVLGSLRALRSALAPPMRGYLAKRKRLRSALAKLELALADDSEFAAPDAERGSSLLDGITEAIETDQTELGALFAELATMGKALRKRRVRLTRLEKAERKAGCPQPRAK